MTKRSPAFQFYVNDYLSDINVQLMTAEEEGAYIRLLCFCWQDTDISLPDDDDQLFVLSKLSKGGSTKALAAVKKCFNQHPTKAGYLTHKRLILEAEKQQKWREKSASGGKKSAENKRKSKGGSRVVQPKGYSSTSFSSSSSIDNTKDSIIPPISPKQSYPPPNGVLDEVWKDYLDMRKKKRSPMTKTAYKKTCDDLMKTMQDPNEVVSQSVQRGWVGVFEIKQEGKQNGAYSNGNGQANRRYNPDDEIKRAYAKGLVLLNSD